LAKWRIIQNKSSLCGAVSLLSCYIVFLCPIGEFTISLFVLLFIECKIFNF